MNDFKRHTMQVTVTKTSQGCSSNNRGALTYEDMAILNSRKNDKQIPSKVFWAKLSKDLGIRNIK